MKTKSTNQKRLHKIITLPLRALIKARDFYVKGILTCADHQSCSFGVLGGMPEPIMGRSFSVNSTKSYKESADEDLRELIRAASTGTLANRIDISKFVQEQEIKSQPYKMPPRSCSVGMGRIDEDNPSSFGELEKVNVKKELACPKSKSYVENSRRNVY